MNPSGKYVLRWKGRQSEPLNLAEIQLKLREHEIGLLHEVYHGGTWITLDKFIAQLREGSGTRDKSQLLGSTDASGISSLKSPPKAPPPAAPLVPPVPLVPPPLAPPPQIFTPPVGSPAWPAMGSSFAPPVLTPSPYQPPMPGGPTPEAASASEVLAYGGFWLRYIASGMDGLVLAPIFWGLAFLAAALAPRGAALPPGWLVLIVLLQLLISWLYFALMESSALQATLGKLALGLLVTDSAGQRLSLARASGRFFGKIVSGLALGIGYFMAAFSERKQALHDIMAGCYVLLRLPRSRIYPN